MTNSIQEIMNLAVEKKNKEDFEERFIAQERRKKEKEEFSIRRPVENREFFFRILGVVCSPEEFVQFGTDGDCISLNEFPDIYFYIDLDYTRYANPEDPHYPYPHVQVRKKCSKCGDAMYSLPCTGLVGLSMRINDMKKLSLCWHCQNTFYERCKRLFKHLCLPKKITA